MRRFAPPGGGEVLDNIPPVPAPTAGRPGESCFFREGYPPAFLCSLESSMSLLSPGHIRLPLLCLLGGMALFLASCRRGKGKSAPAYDLGPSEALLESGLSLERGDGEWEKREKEGRLSPQVARILQEENGQRELMEAANELLREQRYHDFTELLDRAEREGRATPALLQLRGLPQALQALSLFCARRPFTKSQDLEDSLVFLSPWREELSRMAPEAFPPFWEAQEALLASLRQEEFLRRCRACEEELELALLTRQWHSRIPQCLEAFSRLGGEPELLRCLASPPGGWLAPEGWCAARELAAWLRWDELLPQERTSLKRLLEERQPATMAGRLLLGRLTPSPEAFLETLLLWQKAMEGHNGIFSPAFLEEYRQLLPEGGKVAPVTGVAESAFFLYRLLP